MPVSHCAREARAPSADNDALILRHSCSRWPLSPLVPMRSDPARSTRLSFATRCRPTAAAAAAASETLSTLKFAERAAHVRNHARVNDAESAEELRDATLRRCVLLSPRSEPQDAPAWSLSMPTAFPPSVS